MSGALSHVRVLDLSRILAGPWASQILADLGAEVVKVERPGRGDDTRTWGPPYVQDARGGNTSESSYYACTNRNKKSVTIDFTRPEGQRMVRELAAQSDILLENFKLGGLRQYGLDYESLSKVNPRLIYCSITGFGQTGPYAARAGYDFLIQGMGGLMSITGHPDGEPGGGPMKVGVALADILTGMYAATSVLAALSHRDQTGVGQHIDLALLDVQVACLASQAMNYLTTGQVPQRLGNAHPNVVPYQDFPTADGNMILAVGNDSQFARLCQVLDRPEWAADSRYATNAERVRNRGELIPMLRQATVMRTTVEWISLLEQAGVPCGPINNIDQVFQDPHIQARGMQLSMPHPLAGEIPQVASPIRLSETPVEYRQAPPTLGQHTREVLSGLLGLDGEELDRLAKADVI
ncbi:MAG: CoA transferase [Ectothiorhodospiraceae bacterium]|nr:CoA transferase [Ectothiorhodospiraceae bacterium]